MLVLAAGITFFFCFSWAIQNHFVSDQPQPGMLAIAAVSIFGIVTFSWTIWTDPPNLYWLIIGLFFIVSGGLVFCWSVAATRGNEFGLAFDSRSPELFFETGPYRYIRHPFYSSYLLFWIGCAVAAQHTANVVALALLGSLYTAASIGEEQRFAQSNFRERYAEYRKRAGMFWPRLWRK